MDNKYKQLMNNVEVSDEMRQRILQNIGEMDLKPRTTRITPVNARRKATVSRIIGIVAAAGIVLTVGGVILLRYASFGSTKSAEAVQDVAKAKGTFAGVDSADHSINNYIDPAVDALPAEEGTMGDDIPSAAGIRENQDTQAKENEDNLSAVYSFKNERLLRGNKSSAQIDKIIYEDEEGNEYILTDAASISKILSLYDADDEDDGNDHIVLTLYAGDDSCEFNFFGPNVSTIIDIIKDKANVSKKQ